VTICSVLDLLLALQCCIWKFVSGRFWWLRDWIWCRRLEKWFSMKTLNRLAVRLETEICDALRNWKYGVLWNIEDSYWDYDFCLLRDCDWMRCMVISSFLNWSVMRLQIGVNPTSICFEMVVISLYLERRWYFRNALLLNQTEWYNVAGDMDWMKRLQEICYETRILHVVGFAYVKFC